MKEFGRDLFVFLALGLVGLLQAAVLMGWFVAVLGLAALTSWLK